VHYDPRSHSAHEVVGFNVMLQIAHMLISGVHIVHAGISYKIKRNGHLDFPPRFWPPSVI